MATLAVPAPVCAQAGQRPTVDIVVAATTDVHGRLRGWDYYSNAPDSARGLARAATIVDSVRDANPGRVILVDAGDLLQGNPLTYVAARVRRGGEHPVMAAMNAMRYDAAALGNHEFNYGVPTLRAALGQARFPFLAANLRVLGTGGRLPVSKSTLVRRAGVLVGIVGATTPGANIWDRDNLRGRLVVEDIVPAVRREVEAVRRRGASMVVVVTHSGLGEPASFDTAATGLPSENVSARLAHEVPGIDLIVYGHTHRQLADTTINDVMLMQPRNWATSVAVATVTLERRPAGWRKVSHRGTLVQSAGHTEHPAVVRAVERQHRATVDWVNTSLGSTPVAWSADSARVVDVPIIDFILEVQRRATGAQLSSTAAFDVNASLDAGDITIAEVARLYPYDNTLRAIRLSGRQLREYLEHSARYYRTTGSPEAQRSLVDPAIPGFNFDIVAGADYELDISKPLGSRVTTLSVGGRAVADADTFTMALNNYRQSGGGGFAMLAGAPVVHDRGEEIRDLLIDEVRRARILRPEDYHTRNWRLAPPAAVAAAYQSIRADAFNQPSLRSEGPIAGSHLSTGRWLRVIGTNDFHGGLDPGDFNASGVVRGGIAHLIGAIEQARSECRPPTCHSIWIDGGD
ncbi:MAG: 5'-nucleotidase C-terminal domain-containing protein, partial [Gemmatimonadota bacterium]